MADQFAEPADLEARWRPLSEQETNVADTLLGDASAMIRGRWPDVDSRVAAGSPTEDDLVRVVCAMVKRAMLGADAAGVTQQSQASGPFSLSQTYANPTGNLYLSGDEIALFDGYGTRVRVGWLA